MTHKEFLFFAVCYLLEIACFVDFLNHTLIFLMNEVKAMLFC